MNFANKVCHNRVCHSRLTFKALYLLWKLVLLKFTFNHLGCGSVQSRSVWVLNYSLHPNYPTVRGRIVERERKSQLSQSISHLSTNFWQLIYKAIYSIPYKERADQSYLVEINKYIHYLKVIMQFLYISKNKISFSMADQQFRHISVDTSSYHAQ